MRQVSLCVALMTAITAIGWVQAGSAAAPGIVVDRGLAGVSLGMTQAQARARLGKPTLVRCDGNGVPSRHVVWGWGKPLGGSLAPGTGVEVRFPAQSWPSLRTQTGLGVGVAQAQVEAGLPPRSLCRMTARRGFCYIRPDAAGGSTRFLFTSGKVTSVELQQELGGR